MIQGNNGVPWRRSVPRFALAAIVPLLLAIVAACSGAAPTPATTTIAPPPTATPAATTAPPVPSPTTAATTAPASTPPPPTAAAATEPPATVLDADKLAALSDASDKVYALLEELVAELGHRVSGSEEELRAAELLKERYESMGYEVEIQPFVRHFFDFGRWFTSGGENGAVVVESADELRFEGLPINTSPDTTQNSGPLMTLYLGKGDTLPTDELAGKVIHILTEDLDPLDRQMIRGMHDRIKMLADAGAVAVVISQSQGLPAQFPIVSDVEFSIPALFLQKHLGLRLADLAAIKEELVVSVMIETERLESRNVIAELPGTGDDVVVVGAHYDIVPATEAGANDNASGTAVILALAKTLAEEPLPYTVRFVSFGAEEEGLYGSSHYVASLSDAEFGRLGAMLNFDVVGSGEFTAVTGDPRLTEATLQLAGELQLQAQAGSLPSNASSDHTPFERAGVPVLLFWAPDISRIHSRWDVMEFVEPQRLGETFLLAEALLTSPEFPPR